jgi:hypothetical protein
MLQFAHEAVLTAEPWLTTPLHPPRSRRVASGHEEETMEHFEILSKP